MPVQANNALILDENGLTRLLGTLDYMQFDGGLSNSPVGDNGTSSGAFTTLTAGTSLAITGSASITGDLTVEGIINSSGTTDSITKDAVIDLLHGNTNIVAAKAGGLSANLWPSDATNCGGVAGLAVKEFKIAGSGGANAQVEMNAAVAQAAASIAGNFIVTGIASIGDTFTVGTCKEDVVFVAQAGGGGGGAKTFNTGGDVNAQGTNLSAAIAAYTGLDSTDAGVGSPNFTLGAVDTVNLGSGQNGRTATAQQVAGGSAFVVTVPGAGVYAGGTGLSEGMFIEISDADSTENDGLFQIVGIAGALIDVAGSGANPVSPNAPWVQTAFIVEADVNAKVRAINLAGLAFSNGALTDQSGAAITIGSVCDSYTGTQTAAATSIPAMVRDVYWTVSGSDSLQKAYQVGSEIALLDTDGNLRISTDDSGARADFVVSNEATTSNYLSTTATGLQLGSGTTLLIDLNGNVSSGVTFDGANAKTITQDDDNLSLTTTGGGAGKGDLTVDASQDLYLTGGTLTTVTATAGDLTLDASAGAALITAVATSSFTVNGVAKTLTIESKDSAAGGGAQKLLLASDGSGADALQMASTGGGFDLQSIDDSTISCFAPASAGANTALVIASTNAAAARTASLTLSADDVLSATSETITITAGLDSTWSMAADINASHTLSILATNANATAGADGRLELKAQGESASGILIENDGGGSAAAGILINAKNTSAVVNALAKVASQGDIELDADYAMLLDAGASLTLDCTSTVPAITTSAFTNQSGSQIQDGMCVTISGNAQVSAADAQTAAGKVPLAVSPGSWANGQVATIGTFLGSTSTVRIMEAHSRGWLEVTNNGGLANGDTITISGAANLVAGGQAGEWAIGGSAAATAANIVAVINAQAGNKVFASIFGDKVLLQSTERAVANSLAASNAAITISAATLVKVGVDVLTHTGTVPVAGSILYLASSIDPSRVAGGGFSTLSAPSGSGDSVIRIGTVVKAAGGGLGTKASPSKSTMLWNTQFIANHP